MVKNKKKARKNGKVQQSVEKKSKNIKFGRCRKTLEHIIRKQKKKKENKYRRR